MGHQSEDVATTTTNASNVIASAVRIRFRRNISFRIALVKTYLDQAMAAILSSNRLAAALLAAAVTRSSTFDHMKRLLPFIIILLVLGVAVVSAYYLKRSASASVRTNGRRADNSSNHSTGAVRLNRVFGDQPMRRYLEEFGDFECPP